MRTKKGISLITLVITIIIVIVLAAAVILTLNNNNPIENAREATFKSDVSTIKSDYNLYISDKYSKSNGIFDMTSLNLNETTSPKIAEEIKSVAGSNLEGKVKVVSGKLVFTGTDEKEKEWFNEIIGIGEGTINREEAAWNKPYIPSEFHYVEGEVATGYVIADNEGNEFVWIPVDGTKVAYEKWCTIGSVSHTNTQEVSDGEYPSGITSETEKSIVDAVGGFYIGRYEAGVPSNQTAINGNSAPTSNVAGIPVSKKGATVWTYIDYTNANNNARAYKNNAEVASGLLTGTQWDTVCKWLQNSNYDVTDSRTWGNYNNSQPPANVEGAGSKQTAGYSEEWKANNIYDFAGNTWEWTNEMYSSIRLVRGGSCYNSGSSSPGSVRLSVSVGYTNIDVGFRLALYVK